MTLTLTVNPNFNRGADVDGSLRGVRGQMSRQRVAIRRQRRKLQRTPRCDQRLAKPENKLPSIEDRGQTDRVTTPTRARLRMSQPSHAACLNMLTRS